MLFEAQLLLSMSSASSSSSSSLLLLSSVLLLLKQLSKVKCSATETMNPLTMMIETSRYMADDVNDCSMGRIVV
jgi:hypothetical protein